MDRLFERARWSGEQPLWKNFENSVFPCLGINFGPTACSIRHRDTRNLPYGWCAITALGNFNSKTGGHLVLHDLELILEFPANSTILMPSATLAHANTIVEEGSSRASFTQFSAGDLFRFVDCGFKTLKTLRNEDPTEYEEVRKKQRQNWENGIQLFSLIAEIKNDYHNLYETR